MESFLIVLMESYFRVIRKYMDFSGRADRREFWMFALCNFIVWIVFAILSKIPILGFIFRIVSFLYMLAVLVPSLAVAARRLHDTNQSGFLLFIALVPFAGIVVVLILCALQGTMGDNRYGPDPREL
jgi:uncharacterized membrane protein YhaH (DUF805 family)